MKKNILYLAIIALIVGGAWYADRAYLKKNATVKAGPNASANLPDAPDFSTKDLNGKTVSLADYRGKVVLVNFWATYCGPCKVEMPWLIEFQQKYGDRGFVVLGLAMDPEGKSIIEPWLAEQKWEVNGQKISVNYPILLGNDDIADKFEGIFGLPTTLIISRDGKIVKRYIGAATFEKFTKDIEANL
jgi:cytochrome c biogenesis protein CcmG/thiol:disulfide interchange protein DsbE